MKNSPLHTILSACGAFALLSSIAEAKLAAWYPLDEPDSDTSTAVTENIAGNGATTIGLDADPALSFITRGHPSARQNLGTAYLLQKGGGLDLGADPAVQPTDKFTISFWCQPGTLDNFDRFLESKINNANTQNGIRIDMGGNGNGIRVLVRDGNGAVNTQSTHPTSIKTDGTWYFFAFRYDSAGIDNAPFQLTLVEANGTAVDEAAITAATAGPATINTGAISAPHEMNTLIGLENSAGTGGNTLHSAMDELAFYDNSDGMGVLSNAQLADVYNFGPSGVELITSFSSSDDSVAPDTPVTLSWAVNVPFDTLVIDAGGEIIDAAPNTVAGIGSIEVVPEVTAVYALRATRGEAANVFKLRILAGAAPEIGSFTASAPIVQLGGSVDLSWVVTGADSLQLDPGATDVSGLTSTNLSPTETTTYTLSATNPFGTTTAEVTVAVTAGPVPAHRYDAATAGNTDGTWIDEVAAKNWAMNTALRAAPLAIASANTNLTASYSTGGGVSGGSTGSFQLGDFTAEIWLRPGVLGADHEVIFESGGGQNGIGLLVNEDALRFIGSAVNVRTLDVTIPLDGLNLDDFIQVVFSIKADTDAFEASVRDTFGNVRTASETADIVIGANGAGLFIHASGGLGGDNNLGGRTEDPAALPAPLNGFAGEIALVNVFNRILDTTDIQAAFDAVATTVDPPGDAPFTITKIVHGGDANTVTLTWDSIVGNLFDAQFSTDLTQWFNLDATVSATAEETTSTFNIPPNRKKFFLRIIDLGED